MASGGLLQGLFTTTNQRAQLDEQVDTGVELSIQLRGCVGFGFLRRVQPRQHSGIVAAVGHGEPREHGACFVGVDGVDGVAHVGGSLQPTGQQLELVATRAGQIAASLLAPRWNVGRFSLAKVGSFRLSAGKCLIGFLGAASAGLNLPRMKHKNTSPDAQTLAREAAAAALAGKDNEASELLRLLRTVDADAAAIVAALAYGASTDWIW